MISLNSQASDEAGKNIGTEAVQPFGPVYRKIELVTYIQNALYLIGNVVIFQNMVDFNIPGTFKHLKMTIFVRAVYCRTLWESMNSWI